MRYNKLGTTGLYVSELCLGTMTFGGRGYWEAIGRVSSAEAERLIGTAFDAGVTMIDTADVYSEGEAETITGAALAALKRPREQVVVATKVRGRTGPGPNQVGLSRNHILASIDASLRRLRLDYVDLYQIHGMDLETPVEETMRTLDDVVRSGRARYIGFCNLPAWAAMKALAFADSGGHSRFVSAQMYYSIVSRDIEREMVPFVGDQDLALLPWSPLAGGLLSGKFDPDKAGPAGSRRTSFDFPPVDKSRFSAVLTELRSVAAALGVSVARTALAWLLTRGFVTSVIIGVKTMEQLKDNLAASEVNLSAEHIAKLDTVSDLPAEYPGWMVAWQNRDRSPAPAA
jgi:aryl-alcohol dehydrogenase-like predicted oxidoreductase